MQNMFDAHFSKESKPKDITLLLDVQEVLQSYSRALRSMQIPMNLLDKALTNELSEATHDIGILIALVELKIDAELKEYYNATN